MSDIQIFNNPQFGEIRTAVDCNTEPLFCLVDVCNALGIKNSRDVKNRLDEDDVVLTDAIDSLGRKQQLTYVTESGLYTVIIRSDADMAKPFRRWITKEVLPTLRKTGSYSVREESKEERLRLGVMWVQGVSDILHLNDASKLSLLSKIAAPLQLPLPDYVASKGILKSARELLAERGLGVSAQAFNKKAVEKGYLCNVERSAGRGQKKHFKSITGIGLEYGENLVNPNNPRSTQPSWYADRFDELYKRVMA